MGERAPQVESVGSGWALGETLGAGGTARVLRAIHQDGRSAAVKILHSRLAEDPVAVRRFQREVLLLSTLEHPALPRLYEAGTMPDSRPFAVVELLEGLSLDATRTTRGGVLPAGEVIEYVDAVLGVLSFVHGHGVVHRDLKPSNVFRTRAGGIKLLDFGAATLPAGAAEADTLTRGLLGTPAYMAPEQARGRWDLVDERTDIWSVGALMFTLLSGEPVHAAATEDERLGLAMSSPARSLASLAPDLDPDLVFVVGRALGYDREERWQSASEFRRALKDAAEGRLRSLSQEATLRDPPRASPSSRSSFRGAPIAWLALLTLGAASSPLFIRSTSAVRPARPAAIGPRASAASVPVPTAETPRHAIASVQKSPRPVQSSLPRMRSERSAKAAPLRNAPPLPAVSPLEGAFGRSVLDTRVAPAKAVPASGDLLDRRE